MLGETIFTDLMYRLDENKVPVPILTGELAAFLAKGGKTGGRMNLTLIGSECVSTVFLGVRCPSTDGGYFFETAVWSGYDYKTDEVTGTPNIVARCLTYEQAIQNHEDVCAALSAVNKVF